MGDARPLGYAVVGCGRISESHLRAARALPDDLDLVAVVDVDAIAIAEAALASARQGRAVSLDELAPAPGGPA